MKKDVKKELIFNIPIDIYRCNVVFILNYKKENINSLIKNLIKKRIIHNDDTPFFQEKLNDDKFGALTVNCLPNILVFYPYNKELDLNQTLAIIVHEICHVAYMILSYHDINLDLSTDEVYAYIQQYIFQEYLDKITEEIKTKKKSK